MVKKRELFMEDLSWTEIADKLEEGYTNVIVIAASMEQHGPHLPTAADTLIGYYLAENIARRLGKTLVAPAIRPGCTGGHPEHMPGTIEITPDLLRETVRCYIRSLARDGFKNIILLCTHGGQHHEVRRVWEEERGNLKGANVIFVADNVEYYKSWNDFWETRGIPPRPTHSAHAGLSETSLLLASNPDLVDMSKAVVGETGVDLIRVFEDVRDGKRRFEDVIDSFRTKRVMEVGVFGDPTIASSEGGARFMDYLVKYYIDRFEKELR
jgi:creatinine amidohydrolase